MDPRGALRPHTARRRLAWPQRCCCRLCTCQLRVSRLMLASDLNADARHARGCKRLLNGLSSLKGCIDLR